MAGVILQALLGLGFLASGGSKLAGAPAAAEQFSHYRYAPWFRSLIGVLEVLGAAGLLVGNWLHALVPLAGIGLGILMLGALYTHLARAGDPAGKAIPSGVLLVLLVAVTVLRWSSLGGGA